MAAPLVTIVPTIVYKVTNLLNGECYIGITIRTLRARMAEHKSYRREIGYNGPLCLAIRKHGFEQFRAEIVETHASYEEAGRAEMRLIAELRPYYNRSPGGDGVKGCWIGMKLRPETREKIRLARLANPCRYWLGKKREPHVAEMLRTVNIGRKNPKLTELALHTSAENMRKAARARRRPVRCQADGRVFESAVDAAAAYGLDYRRIHLSIKRARPYDGYMFSYEVA